jgi:CheY-like chemotaxis protein
MPARGFVLVVDDEDMVRDVCRRMLLHAGWAVLDADGGQSAIDVFAAHADEVACVILDLSMPQMDGFAVFRALRAIRPDVRVILSSGYSRDHEAGADLTAEGFAGFIQKPYAARTLRDEVARVVTGTPPR